MFDENDDPDVSAFVVGYANELQQKRQQQMQAQARAQQARRPAQVVGNDSSSTVTMNVRDLLDAMSRSSSNSQAPMSIGAMLPKPSDVPWGWIAALGVGVGLALGLAIASHSKRR